LGTQKAVPNSILFKEKRNEKSCITYCYSGSLGVAVVAARYGGIKFALKG